ncbi:DUF6382 domain-containing protein [Paenibacillus piri]|uniref:FHA domain-containing protein n=1 Tax=Paenibacillus piri TaxID=2547395 RepID=A0A4R5KVR7_9BACL|nr:DUF6382 domain-containing protein [Paenibacillus piri]TDF99592.1 FHA domain-containing protein [Paenibacillus piri]
MPSQLYGLQADYVSRNGHFMVLSCAEGLRREELSAFQVNMLLANKIPCLLDLQVEEMDQQIKLYYNITGKRMLTHWLRLQRISMKQFFTLLYRIVETVADSHIYMLQEGRYVLKEDYIYCGDDWNDLHLTYIPKELLPEKNAVSADLQHLAARLVHKVTELSGNGYQELMNYLLDESFNLPMLKKLLLKHMNQPAGEAAGGYGTVQPISHGAELKSDAAWIHREKPLPPEVFVKPFRPEPDLRQPTVKDVQTGSSIMKESDSKIVEPPASPAAAPWDGLETAEADQHRKLRLPIMLIGFLSICLIWKLYLDHPGEAWLMICSGLTLLTADLVFIALWIWMPPKTREDEDDPELWDIRRQAALEGDHRSLASSSEKSGLIPFFNAAESQPRQTQAGLIPAESRLAAKLDTGIDARLNTKFDTRFDAKFDAKFDKKIDSKHDNEPDPMMDPIPPGKRNELPGERRSDAHYRSLEQRTTLLSPRDATVLLSNAQMQSRASQAVLPYLERIGGGLPAKAHIDKASFVIGRTGGEVDLVHDEEGMSRVHAEIVRESGEYWIKDLGSRNGTTLNGEILVPYRMYSLQEGDIVKLIATDYMFKMGS